MALAIGVFRVQVKKNKCVTKNRLRVQAAPLPEHPLGGLVLLAPHHLALPLIAPSQEGQGRYVGKYNCDVHFAGTKGACGMMLVPTSEVMEYDASASADAAEGTWFFINKIAE